MQRSKTYKQQTCKTNKQKKKERVLTNFFLQNVDEGCGCFNSSKTCI